MSVENEITTGSAANKWERMLKLAPVLLVVATGMFYLNGVAFRQGYLSHFHLHNSMFDDDVGSQVSFAVRAWQELFNMVVSRAGAALIAWILPYVTGVVVVGWLLWRLEGRHRAHRQAARSRRMLINPKLRRQADKRRIARARPHPFRNTPLARKFALGAWVIIFVGTSLFLIVDVMGLALGACVWPFIYAGESLAIQDERTGFADAPWVTLTTPEGQKVIFRLITCAPRFCALYRPDRIITVPVSAMTWLTNEAKPGPTAGSTPSNCHNHHNRQRRRARLSVLRTRRGARKSTAARQCKAHRCRAQVSASTLSTIGLGRRLDSHASPARVAT